MGLRLVLKTASLSISLGREGFLINVGMLGLTPSRIDNGISDFQVGIS